MLRVGLRTSALFCLLTLAHAVATVVLLVYVFGAGMARFDTGAEASWLDSAAEAAFRVLSFPVLLLLERQSTLRFPHLWGYVPILANSALWAAVFTRVREEAISAAVGDGAVKRGSLPEFVPWSR